ncbi:MAG: ABC transporter ATP-binding protein [Gemmatimonadetes bacterium]|nr:ABC transporter ATP-binding protein [Gemmatimonadota bacterium]MYB70902.1 ABC transporter ATP-binding protein [Gemmatimonadota bacterium]
MNEELIEIEDLRFGWPSAAPLLSCDHFLLRRGEHLYIRGPSGSGKSTLLNLLAGVLTPDSGRLSLMRQDTGSLASAARDRLRADHIGFIFQQFNLVPYLNLAENVVLPCHFSRRRATRAVEAHGGVTAAAQLLLQRLFVEEELDPTAPVSRLSVGQQQRVAAARALMGDPEIVIADEPTSALDFDARARFIELLFEQVQASRATLVFVSHDPTLAACFDRTVDIDDFRAETRP